MSFRLFWNISSVQFCNFMLLVFSEMDSFLSVIVHIGRMLLLCAIIVCCIHL